MNALGYVRISNQDQSNYSLDNQERQIREYCQRNGLTLLATFTDNGESSYTFDRPDFKALEDFIKKNKNVQYLVVMEMDRFSRNLAEALIKIKELQDKHNIKVVATTDSFNTDFSDPSTFMLRAFKFLLAENELHRIRKRTKDGLAQARLSGRFVNKAPYGYKNARDAEGKAILLVDEEKAVHVRILFREFIRGAGVEEARRIAKKAGYTGKGNSAVTVLLSNPLYAGLVKAGHKTVKGIHAPIISEQDYWFAQQKLNRKGISHQNREEVPLRGVLRSPFGDLLTAGNSRGRTGRYYWYYVDRRNKLNFPAEKLHKKFAELLRNMSFDQAALEKTRMVYEAWLEEYNAGRSGEVKKLKSDLSKIERRIETVEQKFLLQPDISQQTYNTIISDLRAEQSRLQQKMAELQNYSGGQILNLLPVLSDVYSGYEALPLNYKHQFINTCFDRSLSFDSSTYRTRSLHSAFRSKALILKEKGLLIIEQPVIKMGETPSRSEIGTLIETLSPFDDLNEILKPFRSAV